MTDKWLETSAILIAAIAKAVAPLRDKGTAIEFDPVGNIMVLRMQKNNVCCAIAVTMMADSPRNDKGKEKNAEHT